MLQCWPVSCYLSCWIVFHCVNLPHFLYPLLSQWTGGLFEGLGYYEQCCRDHSCTSHCVDRVLRYIQKERKKWRAKTDPQAVSGMHPLLRGWSSGTGGAGIREWRGAPEWPFWPWHSPGRTHRGEGSSPLEPACMPEVPPWPQDTCDNLSPPRHPFPSTKVLKQQMKKTPAVSNKSSPDGSPGTVVLEEGCSPAGWGVET